jgi:hypothetical protein
MGITSKAAGPKPTSAAAYMPYVEGELPYTSDAEPQLAAAPPAPKAPASRKGAPLASTPKARATAPPIGAKPPAAKKDFDKGIDKGKGSKQQQDRQPAKEKEKGKVQDKKKPPPIGGRPPARGRSRTRSYSGSYYSDSEYSVGRGPATRAAPIGARAKPGSSSTDKKHLHEEKHRAGKGRQRPQRRISPRTPSRSPARARASARRPPVQLVSAAAVAAGARKKDDDIHAAAGGSASHRHFKNKGVKARIHRILLQRAEANSTSLAVEKTRALEEATRQGILAAGVA